MGEKKVDTPSKWQVCSFSSVNHLIKFFSDFVVKFIDLKTDTEYGFILIEEDDQAESLANCIPQTGFELLEFLRIAIQLVKGLQDIHRSKAIHRDIRPCNIIIQHESGLVKYIDFGNSLLSNKSNK